MTETVKLRKFKALVNEKGLDDWGDFSSTFTVDELVKGKIYTQADQRNYDAHGRSMKPFFVDDNGCSRDIMTALKNGIVEEIFED